MSRSGPIVFRFDATPSLGVGHLQRCLALSSVLEARGCECHFFSHIENIRFQDHGKWVRLKAGEGNAGQLLEYSRAVGASGLVLDHYGVDEDYQQTLLPGGIPWLQFEGVPHQRLWARWVLAAGPGAFPELYTPWLQSTETELLLGPSYAILRTDFLRIESRAFSCHEVREVVVTFGGGWDRGGILLCLATLSHWRERIRVHVLTTAANPSVPALQSWLMAHGLGWADLALDAQDFPERLASADLAIIAGGTTTFEAAHLGIPALIIQIADNQKGQASALSRLGVAENLGPLESLDAGKLHRAVASIIDDSDKRKMMSEMGRALVDGQGVYRVVAELMKGPSSGKNAFT